jgi:methyl-accepting chemotaxis protein
MKLFGSSTYPHLARALNGLASNVMIADDQLNIVYLNDAVRGFLKQSESEIQKEMPSFSVDTLIGRNIDVFHKNPEHNRRMLSNLRDVHKATIRISGKAFDLNVRAFYVKEKKTGYSVEWSDADLRLQNIDYADTLQALDKSQARIEFDPTGRVIAANQVFLDLMGYTAKEVIGAMHATFVEPDYRASRDYEQFWHDLRNGDFKDGEFKRIGKGGREVFIQGQYLPVKDAATGQVRKVVKLATDVSDRVNSTHKVAACLSGLAEGDLTQRVGSDLAPAIAKIGLDINKVAESLQQAMQTIADRAESMQAGSASISKAADALSRRTEQQAANLEESAAALSAVTGSVKATADMAQTANDTVRSTKKESEDSGRVVEDAVVAMQAIAKSAQEISQIIGVIDEIAFQTNLLALNAGVEAARAGDAGKGFAVVASEVRALAQRSAEAAKEIKALILTSGEQVSRGVDLVGQAGAALKRISTGVVTISESIEKIAGQAHEQSNSIVEVNTAVSQMDRVVQENAAMVEETNASSASLARDSGALYELTLRFNTGKGDRAHVRDVREANASAKPARPPASRAASGFVRKGANVAVAEKQPDDWADF